MVPIVPSPPLIVQQKIVSFTAAQLIASTATPIPLVNAPGAGLVIVPMLIGYKLNFGTVAFTNPSGGPGYPFWGSAAGAQAGGYGDSVVFTSGASAIAFDTAALDNLFPASELENLALVYSGSYAGGNGTGRIIVNYCVMPL